MMRVVIALVLAACGAEPSRPVEPAAPIRQPADAAQVDQEAAMARAREEGLADAGGALAAIDAVAIVDLDAAVAVVDAGPPPKTRQCFCFSWVHLDENGENCYQTKPKCDVEFKSFGRDMKIACAAAQKPRCGGYACRNIGKECFSLY